MKGIKTFPVVLTVEDHKKIKDEAEKSNLSMYKYFLLAVSEKIERDNK